METFLEKLTSRKFLISVAAFLGSIGMSIAGLATQNTCVATVGTVCMILSAAIYAAMEASVDKASVEANAIKIELVDDEESEEN